MIFLIVYVVTIWTILITSILIPISGNANLDFLNEVNDYGQSRLIYTDINRDGMKQSPNFDETSKVAEVSNCPVIISGGVSSIEDIKKAKKLNKNIEGIIVGKAIYDGDTIVAFFSSEDQDIDFDLFKILRCDDSVIKVEKSWDIFSKNGAAIAADFELITDGRTSAAIQERTEAFNTEKIFIEEGAQLPLCVLNATNGPIYIGKNSEIMEGSLVRGPFALCEGSVLKMGAKIYGPTTIGPYSKIGGEVNNSVFFGNSNKGHDGYLGNSIVGEWCNLGADTNNSNLKNNYAEVRLWSYETENFAKTGLQFCGLMMGDHSKCGINTMFNTGTIIGVSANIFGSGFPRNFIPSFSWGGASGFSTYLTSKAFEVASVVMSRRGLDFSTQDKAILEQVFEQTSAYRKD